MNNTQEHTQEGKEVKTPMKNNMVITIIIVVVVAAAAFYGGTKYQQSQTTVSAASSNGGQYQQGNGGFRGGRFGNGGNRATIGQIVSVDANSITVQLPDGSSKIVNVSNSTKLNKMSPAQQTDLVNGERVAVIGGSNSDGSINAQNIQINPMMRGGGMRQGTPSAQPTQ